MNGPVVVVMAVTFKRMQRRDGIGDEREIKNEEDSIRVRDVLQLKS